MRSSAAKLRQLGVARHMVKKIIVWTAVIVCCLVLGHISGRIVQHLKTGYHYDVRQEQQIPFQSRFLSVQSVTESIGFPLLTPDTNILALDDVTIYKAKSNWQEGVPVPRDVRVDGDEISWNDGEHRYRLHVEPVSDTPANTESATCGETEHENRKDTNQTPQG